MKLRIGPAIAGTVALIAAAITAITGTASAEGPTTTASYDWKVDKPGATLYIKEYGDVVTVCGAGAYVQIRHSRGAYELHVGGVCKSARASDGGVYNLPEDETIEYSLIKEPYGYYGEWYNDH